MFFFAELLVKLQIKAIFAPEPSACDTSMYPTCSADDTCNFRCGPPTPQARKNSKIYEINSTPLPLIVQNLQFLWISKDDLWKFSEIPRKFHQNRYEKRRICEKKWKFCKISWKNRENVDEILLNFCDWSGAKVCKSCRSRKMLKNAPTLAIGAVHTEENEPLKNLEVIQFNIHSPP